MRTFAGLVLRLVVYAMIVAVAFFIARAEWSAFGLDALGGGADEAAARIARWGDRLPVAVPLATFLIALLGGVWRPLGTFLLWALVAAILTAPFAIARAAGG